MAGQEGQCPTCGNNIIIPILDRYGRLIDPMTGKVIRQDPHPVHAYAAAGERAPRIVRRQEGTLAIQCPRCPSVSSIDANNCKACGMPFTMEGTTSDAAGATNGFAVASLVMGIIGIPASCTGVIPVLAIIFGAVALTQLSNSLTGGGGRGMAIAGILCGLVGCVIAMSIYLR
jgi:ribosomal protein L37E